MSWLDKLFGPMEGETIDQDLLLLVGRWQKKGMTDKQIAVRLATLSRALSNQTPGISSQGA
jgi:hypothetical protein